MSNNKKINFVIVSPQFSNSSGGILVLHKLAHLLAEFGEQAYINVPTLNSSKAKYLSQEQILSLNFNRTMFIYPEIITGNPYNAKHITRWLLNTPGIIAGNGVYGKSDLVYKFWNYFKAPDEDNVNGELRCFDLKLNQFNNKNFPKSGECFLIKKGAYAGKKINKHSSSALNLDKFISDEYLSYVFNLKEKFISYDVLTYHSIQAALCGCISIVIPDDGVTKEQWINTCPINKYGVAYGVDDIEWAKNTMHLVRDNLIKLENESLILIKNFIKNCYDHILNA